jgi:hypothetical protein
MLLPQKWPRRWRDPGGLIGGVAIATPGCYSPIGPEGEAMMASGGHGYDVIKTRRNICLSVRIISPGNHESVGAQRQDVLKSETA